MSQPFNFRCLPRAHHFADCDLVRAQRENAAVDLDDPIEAAIEKALERARKFPDRSIACKLSLSERVPTIIPVLPTMIAANVHALNQKLMNAEILTETLRIIEMDEVPADIGKFLSLFHQTVEKIKSPDSINLIQKFQRNFATAEPEMMRTSLHGLSDIALRQAAEYHNGFLPASFVPMHIASRPCAHHIRRVAPA